MASIDKSYFTYNKQFRDRWEIEVDEHDPELNAKKVKVVGDYFTNDIDDYSEANVFYIGKEKSDGTWLILKIDMNAGTVIRGANEKNNPTYIDYASAWDARLNLVYDYLKNIL